MAAQKPVEWVQAVITRFDEQVRAPLNLSERLVCTDAQLSSCRSASVQPLRVSVLILMLLCLYPVTTLNAWDATSLVVHVAQHPLLNLELRSYQL